jgi:hypothetical protein
MSDAYPNILKGHALKHDHILYTIFTFLSREVIDKPQFMAYLRVFYF